MICFGHVFGVLRSVRQWREEIPQAYAIEHLPRAKHVSKIRFVTHLVTIKLAAITMHDSAPPAPLQ